MYCDTFVEIFVVRGLDQRVVAIGDDTIFHGNYPHSAGAVSREGSGFKVDGYKAIVHCLVGSII